MVVVRREDVTLACRMRRRIVMSYVRAHQRPAWSGTSDDAIITLGHGIAAIMFHAHE